jgi:hypothetical protein
MQIHIIYLSQGEDIGCISDIYMLFKGLISLSYLVPLTLIPLDLESMSSQVQPSGVPIQKKSL